MGTGVRSKIDSWRSSKAAGGSATSAENAERANIDYLIIKYRIEAVGDKMKVVAPSNRSDSDQKEIEFLKNNKQKIIDRIKEKAEAKEKYNKKYNDIVSDNRDLVRSLRSVAGNTTVNVVVNDIISKGLSPEKAKKALKDAIIRERSLRS